MQLNGMVWELVLSNLRVHSDVFLHGFRRSCEQQLEHNDPRQVDMAKFMLDAIDHILNERRHGDGASIGGTA